MLKMKTLTIFLLILGIILFLFYMWGSLPVGQDPVGEENKLEEDALQAAVEKAPAYLEETVLLELLLDDSSTKAKEELKRFAEKENAVGYMSNLALAERNGDLEKSPKFYYNRALDLYETDEVRLHLAACLAENGEKQKAIEQYLLLVPNREAMSQLTELEAEATAVSRALMVGSHWQEAVFYIDKALADEDMTADLRLELTGKLGKSFAQLGEYAQALPYLKEAYKKGLTDFAWWYARTLEVTGDIDNAVSIYRELGETGAYRLGLILRDQDHKEEAAQALTRSDHPAARWQGAKLWEELGLLEKALEIYEELAYGESRYEDDAAYRAYVLMEREGLEGVEEMLEILQDYPVWLMRLTGETGLEKNPTPSYETSKFIKVVEALKKNERTEMAEIELAIGQDTAGLEEKLALGDWYLEQEDYFRATRWGIRSLDEEKTCRGYHLAYQRPFEEYVHTAADKYELDPHLIWSVMREESHFRPYAVSWVGARGLMQVMPATGQDIAEQKNLDITDEDLLKPETSIDFGAYYLRQMLDMFDDDVDKALAAYNGGSGNVRRWSSSLLGTTAEDFPTAITFVETREFIAKVLNTYHTYNWLYGAADEN